MFRSLNGGATWSERQKLLASDKSQNGEFGSSVALSGSMLAVTAKSVDVKGTLNFLLV